MTDETDLTTQPDGNLVGVINPADFYQLEAQTADWQYLIQRAVIRLDLNKDKEANAIYRYVPGMPHPMFLLAKKAIDAKTVAQILGYKGDPADLDRTDIIHLKPIGDQTGWEMPTVPYTGEA